MKTCSFPVERIILGIILWMLSPFFVYGQLLDPVSFHVDTDKLPVSVIPGEAFTVTVEAVIDKGWHLYSIRNRAEDGPIPTTFSSAGESMTIAGDITESGAEIAYDPNFDMELGWHSRHASFRIPVQFDPAFEGGQRIELNVRYQTCDDISCLPPRIKHLAAEVRMPAEPPPAVPSDGAADRGSEPGTAGEGAPGGRGDHQRNVLVVLAIVAGRSVLMLLYNRKPS